MDDVWEAFCGKCEHSYVGQNHFSSGFMFFTCPSSCVKNFAVISFDSLLLFVLLFIVKPSLGTLRIPARLQGFSLSHIFSGIFNGGLGVVYFSYRVWILRENYQKFDTILPLHQWMVLLIQGLTWLLLGSIVIHRGRQHPISFLRLLGFLACLFVGILRFPSLVMVTVWKEVSIAVVLDILSLPGSILLLYCIYKVHKCEETRETTNGFSLHTTFICEGNRSGKTDSGSNVTPYAKAGFLSRISFWWLNPLLEKGKEKNLREEDIPHLRKKDRAESCYLTFMEKLNGQKRTRSSTTPSILWTIILCQWKDILISGFFALLNIVMLTAGPLLLNAFIEVAEGKGAFIYEGYILIILLFLAKCLESLSQRQWYFRSGIIGLQVRSMLSAAIYRKQLRLSNAAKKMHSTSNIMNYVTVDAYGLGEFPYWFHQTWTTGLQLCLSLAILFHYVGLPTIAALVVITLTVLCSVPLAKLQNRFRVKLMLAQDERLKATSEALGNMKVLKLYAWETHFKNVTERLRTEEYRWLSAVQLQKAYSTFLFWSSPVFVSTATFGACYFLGVPFYASNVFTFLSTLRLVQDPIRTIPEVISVVIQAKVSLTRIVRFLEAPELQCGNSRKNHNIEGLKPSITIKSATLSWENNPSKATLRNINLEVKPGEKVAICGEVGSGKSTLFAAILGEVPSIGGNIEVYGKIAYVSQMAWIQTGTIQENILFGTAMDKQRYQEVLDCCSLVQDLEMLPFGDFTEIGERGVNLSGSQKQRIQLARALYQDADIYLLDDPFSAIDAHTATSLFNYVMEALSGKVVLLVTHQVDFLPAFSSVLLIADGEILCAGPYHQLLVSSQEFQNLINAHKHTVGPERLADVASPRSQKITTKERKKLYTVRPFEARTRDQLIKQEEREVGDTGFRPYMQYMNQGKGLLYFTIACLCHLAFLVGLISQNAWIASNVQNPLISRLKLIMVYLIIGFVSIFFVLFRSLFIVVLCLQSSRSIFSQLLNSLFHAPMSFYDSTPLGRILSRVSSDLSIVDLDIPFTSIFAFGTAMNFCASLGVLATLTWQVLFIALPMLYLILHLQRYYIASAKVLMRINGTTKSLVANNLAESIVGAMKIRAFEDEERFFSKNLNIIDINASSFFHNFTADEWLVQRLEMLSAIVLFFSTLTMILLPEGTFSPGFIGMALSYGLSLNTPAVYCIQNQCTLENYMVSVERLFQYIYIPREALGIIKENRPPPSWPVVGKVEICDLKIRYRPETPLVLCGISCTFEGGHNIGIVGRTGSGKTTLISALFRLVEPTDGKIIVDGLDISKIGLHDLRSCIGIIPQDPTLFNGTLKYNLDPLSQHTDQEIWEVVEKCQLRELVKEKEDGLDSLVLEDGSNLSMGQRQLICLGRALLKKSRILVLDEATASIDNSTDSIIQKTIRTEFAGCTVITVAHRIPTVMDCTMVLSISDGKLVEYDEPMRLMKREGSLFGKLVKEYWSHFQC
ncbi:ABC transporter C family member 10-like isoform X2 [Macadamia integrifolia]|uniref:ABC transporter C family member 10-like isoform X2 n=1 Tax=Macadamia integrifolia TaxID=60698 RepID=UPI001C4F2E99|nr:ABC transporter C family member 10-like isoform X2 [Macadamia integrifolia]